MKYLTENGSQPVVINEGSDREFGGGGVLIILLFLLVIAVVAIPMINRREPVASNDSVLASILPAMMVATTTNARQTVDVNSHNVNQNGAGPSNFELYKQGVETNNNVFVQSCETRELIRQDGQATRDLINSQYVHSLELQLAEKNAQLIAKDNQLVSERQFGAITAQNTANYNSLQGQIYTLTTQIPKAPVPAYCVSPYGSYHQGTTFSAGPEYSGCNHRHAC